MLYLRGLWCTLTERRSICHQAEPALLSAGLWEGSRNVPRIQLRWENCVTWARRNVVERFLSPSADDYCCEDVYHTRIDGRRGPKRPRWDWRKFIKSTLSHMNFPFLFLKDNLDNTTKKSFQGVVRHLAEAMSEDSRRFSQRHGIEHQNCSGLLGYSHSIKFVSISNITALSIHVNIQHTAHHEKRKHIFISQT